MSEPASRDRYYFSRPAWLSLAVAYMAGIFLLSSLPNSLLGRVGLSSSFASLLHVPLFGLLALLLLFALGTNRTALGSQGRPYLWAALITTVYGALDEVHQAFAGGRDADLTDGLLDTFGAFVFLALARWHFARRRTRRAAA
ncbi:MAG: VanZ family protein [Vicinamibacteria bacterium]